ncbi:MAG: holo-ACP synthase [Treponema sp.]|nr:holo-ACP synthase [Treponema sp.]
MIYGIGCDIAAVRRFAKWVSDNDMIARFFNEQEIIANGTDLHKCEHYAVRFAAKEAFSKALGTGLAGFNLRNVYIVHDDDGKPKLMLSNVVAELVEKRCGAGARVHVSLSHEKEYALAFVVIEV